MDNSRGLGARVVEAGVAGIVVGLIVAFVLYLLNRLLGTELDPSFWGFLVGLITFVYLLVTKKRISL